MEKNLYPLRSGRPSEEVRRRSRRRPPWRPGLVGVSRTAFLVMAAIGALLLAAGDLYAQCAMCRTALQQSPEGQELAAGFNRGILFLLLAPFVVTAAMALLVCKARLSVLFRRLAGGAKTQ